MQIKKKVSSIIEYPKKAIKKERKEENKEKGGKKRKIKAEGRKEREK